MSLNLNTNIYGKYAQARNSEVNDRLSNSLEKLASGTRINRSSDDPFGLAIANSIKSNNTSLAQAIRNTNDGIALIQIADNAMSEMTNILDTIKSKTIQSAQDGQSFASREAIQKDINRLLKSLNHIAKTTSYNNQVLLNGAFANKEVQVGAFANETVNVSIQTTNISNIGNVRKETHDMTYINDGKQLSLNREISLQIEGKKAETVLMGIESGSGVGKIAEFVNSNSSVYAVKASYNVEFSSYGPIQPGNILDLRVNGVVVGEILDIKKNDDDGRLINAINDKSEITGVIAHTDEAGRLFLKSKDGRAIHLQNYGAVIPTSITSNNNHPKFTGTVSASGDLFGSEGYVLPTVPAAPGTVMINGIDVLDKNQAGSMATVLDMATLSDISNIINISTPLTNVSSEVVTSENGTERLVLNGNIQTLFGFNSYDPANPVFTGLGLNINNIDPTSSNMNENGFIHFGEITLHGDGTEKINSVFLTKVEEGTNPVSAPISNVLQGQVLVNGVDIIGNQPTVNVDTTQKLINLINLKIHQTGVTASKGTLGELVLEGDIKSLTGFNEGKTGFGVNASIEDIGFRIEKPNVTSVKNLESIMNEDMLLTNKGSLIAMDIVDAALRRIDVVRGELGASENRLHSMASKITSTQPLNSNEESRFRDLDFASESAEFNKNKLLAEAGTFAMSQANLAQQNVIKLLQ